MLKVSPLTKVYGSSTLQSPSSPRSTLVCKYYNFVVSKTRLRWIVRWNPSATGVKGMNAQMNVEKIVTAADTSQRRSKVMSRKAISFKKISSRYLLPPGVAVSLARKCAGQCLCVVTNSIFSHILLPT